MARFDYHQVGGGYLVDCQADTLSPLSTRVMVPLMPVADVPPMLRRLHPVLNVGGREWLFAAHLLSAVPVREIGPPLGSLANHEYEIIAALDMLITGI